MVQPLSIDIIQKNYQADLNWRLRRHPQWTSNYELYRDTVIINRLTQRQSVNVPYMKKTLKTYLTQTNWPVDNEYEDKGMRFCEHCGGAIYPEDVAPVKLQINGKNEQLFFHNRHRQDCLAQKLEQLRQQFAAAQQ